MGRYRSIRRCASATMPGSSPGWLNTLGLIRTSQASVSIAASGPPIHQHIHWSTSAWVLASPPQSARSGRLAARYLRIAGDSQKHEAILLQRRHAPIGIFGKILRRAGLAGAGIARDLDEWNIELRREQ